MVNAPIVPANPGETETLAASVSGPSGIKAVVNEEEYSPSLDALGAPASNKLYCPVESTLESPIAPAPL